MNPRLLSVGNFCLDSIDGVYYLGGSVVFNAITSNKLGVNPSILSKGQINTIQSFKEFCDVDVRVVPGIKDTVFLYENFFEDRIQYLKSFSGSIKSEDIPEELHHTDMVLLCPIAGELEPLIIDNFSGMVGVVLQGWLRGFQNNGKVFPLIIDNLEELFTKADFVIVSEEDINGLDILCDWINLCDVLIITRGINGVTVFCGNEEYNIPTINVVENDSIGAGDIFATSYIIRFFETKDPLISARFANIAAALSVRAPRFTSIPSREEIEFFLK